MNSNDKINKVSVLMTCYNQEKFVNKAIQSILSQKTNFDFELLIGEDYSTDNSLKICENYQQKYPNIIKIISDHKNIGLSANQQRLMDASTGEYIAFCEADDYWIDEYKLKKQVEFLDSNPNYSSSAHQSTVIYDNNNLTHDYRDNVPETIETKDLLAKRKFHTASFIFRRNLIDNIDKLPSPLTGWDRAIFLLCSFHGPIKYFHEPMCVYRKNKIGLTSNVTHKMLLNDLSIIGWLTEINPAFPKFKYKAYLYRTIFEYPPKIEIFPLIKYYLLHLVFSFSYFPKNFTDIRISSKRFFKKLFAS